MIFLKIFIEFLFIYRLDTDVNTEILEQELMKKIVLMENNIKEVLSQYILKNNRNIEKLEEETKECLKVFIIDFL